MRNSAFSTVTTNSRGVKSSLTRMTLCRRGRSVLVLTLVFGLVTASIIPVGSSRRYRRSRAGYNFLDRRGTVSFVMASLQRRHGAQVGDDIGQISSFYARIE